MFSEVLIIQVKLLQSTIHEFSSIADKEVVKRIYLKTMQKLLAVTQKATKADNSRDSISMRIDDSSNDSRLAFFSLYCFVFYLMWYLILSSLISYAFMNCLPNPPPAKCPSICTQTMIDVMEFFIVFHITSFLLQSTAIWPGSFTFARIGWWTDQCFI